jgi:hypothetical protein
MLFNFKRKSPLFYLPPSLTVGFRRGEPNRPKKEKFRPLHHFLRILFLVALFRVRAFLLHLSKRLCHVFDLIPNIKAYVDRGALRTRHRDTIAGPRISEHRLAQIPRALYVSCHVVAAVGLNLSLFPFS